MSEQENGSRFQFFPPLPSKEEVEELSNAERMRINLFHLLSLTRLMMQEKVLPEEPAFYHMKLSHFRLLEYLWHNRKNRKGIRLKDVSSYLKITPGGVSQMVESLVRSDIVTRLQSEEDRRSIQLSLSRKGEKLFCRLEEFITDTFREVLKDLEEGEQQAFIQTLEHITMRFSAKQQTNSAEK